MSYTYKRFFQKLYLENESRFAFHGKSEEDVGVWQKQLRKELKNTLGFAVLEKQNEVFLSRPRMIREEECVEEDGYIRKKIVLETLPEVYMPFYMLIPDSKREQISYPAVIAIPAHGANKETVAGIKNHAEVIQKLEETPKEAYGREFVKQGYVVFCPDPPGYGERLEETPREDLYFRGNVKRSVLGSSCKNLALTAEAMGSSFTALEIWDLQRLLDFVCDQPMVDKKRIGCAGFSGGGQYTMWLSAMDERISLGVVSGYVHNYLESILDVHICPCNYAPGLWNICQISDICGLIAPRPLFTENGREDPLNGVRGEESIREEAQKIRHIYELLGKEEAFESHIYEGKHQWYGGCYDFVKKWLNN